MLLKSGDNRQGFSQPVQHCRHLIFIPLNQLPAGNLQQSPLAAGSLLLASRTTFQLPSCCFRQIVMYLPLVVTGLPLASLL